MWPLWPLETFKQLSHVADSVSSCVISSSALLFFTPNLCLHSLNFSLMNTHRYTLFLSLSAYPVAVCLPGLLLGSLWYLGSDKSPSHCALPSASQAALQPLYASLSQPIASNSYGKPPWLLQALHPPSSQRKSRI